MLFTWTAHAQDHFEDSILKVIRRTSESSHFKNYLSLASYFSKMDQFEKSIAYADKALAVSLRNKNRKDELKARTSLASSYYLKSEYPQAEKAFNEALELAKKLKDDASIADISMNLGALKQLNSKYQEAFDLYLKARFIFEKNKKWEELISCYHNIASVLSTLGQVEKVNAYYDKIKHIIPKVKSVSTKIKAYSNLASYYNDYGQNTKESTDLAIEYSQKGIQLSLQEKNYVKLAYLYNCLARAYEIREEYPKSIENYKRSLEYMKESNLQVDYYAYLGLFYCYQALNDDRHAKESLELIKNHHFTKTIDLYKIEYLKMLYEFNKEHDLKAALGNLEEINALREKIKSKENISIITELEKKYNQSKNYTSILELRNQKKLLVEKNKSKNLQIQVLIFSTLFLILVIFISIYLYRQNLKNKKLKMVEMEQNLERVRMNPHFIFNALSSLQALSMDPSKVQLMPEYMARFSKIMRQTLESSFSELIPLEDEIEFLNNYLSIQKLVKGRKFEFEFHVSEEVNTFDTLVPVMIFQPFIENSIEHGFAELQAGGKIDLYFSEKNGSLEVKLLDNGKWSQASANKPYPSRAMEIINSRFFLLQKRYKKNATFELIKKADGVEVEIHIPQFS